MIAIGRYLVFIISLTGMTLSDDRFSEEDVSQFLNHILNLHNDVRNKHGVKPLVRKVQLDVIASEKINKMFTDTYQYVDLYGINYRKQYCNNDSKLDASEAEELFSVWYNTVDEYNYFFEPLHNGNDEFTQIVWKDTKEVGMAFRSVDQNYEVLVVYDPCGNIKGQFTSNVMIPPSLAEARNPRNNMLIYQGDEKRFLTYIWELHNAARRKHKVTILLRNEYLDSKASEFCEMNYEPKFIESCGINTLVRYLYEDFKMDAAEAKAIFSEWYNKGANADDSVALSNKDAGAFRHIMRKDTVFFGVAMRRFTGYYRVVALYSPPGKVQQKYRKNVLRLQYMEQGESSVNN